MYRLEVKSPKEFKYELFVQSKDKEVIKLNIKAAKHYGWDWRVIKATMSPDEFKLYCFRYLNCSMIDVRDFIQNKTELTEADFHRFESHYCRNYLKGLRGN